MGRSYETALIDELLSLDIGDFGRLKYLKEAYSKGAHIYETDKKYLKNLEGKLSKRENTQRQHTFPKFRNFQISSSNTSLIQKSTISNIHSYDYNTNIPMILNEIRELKKTHHKTKESLQIISGKLEKLEIKTKSEQNKTNQKKSTFSDTTINNYVKALTWPAAGFSILWYAGFLNMINLEPIRDIFLGISFGLAAGIVAILRFRKQSE